MKHIRVIIATECAEVFKNKMLLFLFNKQLHIFVFLVNTTITIFRQNWNGIS